MANQLLRDRAADPAGALLPDLPALTQTQLVDFLADASADVLGHDSALGPLVEAARDAVLSGGKRLRPRFAYWGWRATAGPDAPLADVLPALAALELLHAFALVHDDVMDRSATRRGRPTAHRALAATHAAAGLRGDSQHFGNCAAILVGDLCLVWADQLMSRSAVPPARLAAARRSYDRMRVEAIAGQFLDVLGEVTPAWSLERAVRITRLKTASYTVVQPLHFGAALGQSSPDAVSTAIGRAFTRYGLAVGEAFQLRDDLLGVFGDPATTGKPVGDDLAAGKPTVLLQLTRSLANARQATALDQFLRADQGVDVADIAAVIHETGAADLVQRLIGYRVVEAGLALAGAPIEASVAAALAGLAETATWRSR